MNRQGFARLCLPHFVASQYRSTERFGSGKGQGTVRQRLSKSRKSSSRAWETHWRVLLRWIRRMHRILESCPSIILSVCLPSLSSLHKECKSRKDYQELATNTNPLLTPTLWHGWIADRIPVSLLGVEGVQGSIQPLRSERFQTNIEITKNGFQLNRLTKPPTHHSQAISRSALTNHVGGVLQRVPHVISVDGFAHVEGLLLHLGQVLD